MLEHTVEPPGSLTAVHELRQTRAGRTELIRQGRRIRKMHVPYHTRDFIAWDGESVEDTPCHYILFGASTGDEVTARSLSTAECLALIVAVGRRNPNAIHVGFAFHFDATMILKDVSEEKIEQLVKHGWIRWGPYRLNYFRNKWFHVYDTRIKVGVRIFDVFSFFACKFTTACKQYLPDSPDMVQVEAGKDARDTFTWEELDTLIRPYWTVELQLLVRLVSSLRDSLVSADLFIGSWHGPGAVATTLLQREGVRKALCRTLPTGVLDAASYAYFGGRFEQFHTGHYDGKVWAYDIRSAFPYGLTMVPTVNTEWHHVVPDPMRLSPFGVYRVEYRHPNSMAAVSAPHPFPRRNERHQVDYPMYVTGWYWGVEVIAALNHHSEYVTIHEGWEREDTGERPFAFIQDMYEQRAQWKRDGNQAQLAAKLGLNSLYGKLAQRVGWNEVTRTPPVWHQLEYAGYCVAVCRAMIWDAIQQSPGDVIAVESDAIYTTAPLDLTLSDELGQWDCELYDGVVYVQSGVYYLKRGDQWVKARSRGIKRGIVGIDTVLPAVQTLNPVSSNSRRFASFPAYLHTDQLRHWITTTHEIKWGGGGKRLHFPGRCDACCAEHGDWHNLILSDARGGDSHPSVLPWQDEHNPYWTDTDEDLLQRM